jgi:hypothetical protein
VKARWGLVWGFFFFAVFNFIPAQAKNEIVTIPLIAADYYAWAYTEAIEDHASVYGWSTAGVDTLGWGILVFSGDNSGLFMVNLAGISKTVYPVVTLLATHDADTRSRAWIALGTHAATLLSLEFLGHPGLSVSTALGPRQDGTGLTLALAL